jgi:hypothetical protein
MLKNNHASRRVGRLIAIFGAVFLFLVLGASSAFASTPSIGNIIQDAGKSKGGQVGVQNVSGQAASDDFPGVPLPNFSPFGGYVNNSYPEFCVFQFNLAGYQGFSALLSGPGAGEDLDIYLFNQNYSLVAVSEGSGYPEYINYMASSTGGTFYFAIRAYSGYGNYTVSYAIGEPISNVATPLHRFYKFANGVHFYTANPSEATYVNDYLYNTYKYEGVRFPVFPALSSSTAPVYRFYNFLNGVHFYTTNWFEAMDVINFGSWTFQYEGTAFYAYPSQFISPGIRPVYRFYNFRTGAHFYTDSDIEKLQLETSGAWTYRYETIAYWVP